MKSLLIIFAILFNGQFAFTQVKSVMIDSSTKQVIPYVNIWVENEDIGTTSNEYGEFALNVSDPNKMIVFSAIGYTTKKIKVGGIKGFVSLDPYAMVLQEVFVRPKEGTKELVIESFKKSETNNYFINGSSPWIAAKYFDYKDEYQTTPFIKKIKILTKSDIRQATFNLRIYSVNESGDPGEYLYEKNIMGIARKGKNITEVDISQLNIQFPQNGFFVAFEWLIIEANKYEFSYTRQGSKEKYKGLNYEPAIATINGNRQKNAWIYVKGNWRKWEGNPLQDDDKRYRFLAIELTLTN